MFKGGNIAIIGAFLFALFMLGRSYLSGKKENKVSKREFDLEKAESKTIAGIVSESSITISQTVARSNKIYTDTLRGLSKGKLSSLKKSRKGVDKLTDEIDGLRNNLVFFIKNLEETSVRGSNFYIEILGYLEDMAQSLRFITRASYKHINNNHKPLRFNQIRDLQNIDNILEEFLSQIEVSVANQDFEAIGACISRREELYATLNDKIEKQIARTRSEESSPKNTALYFSLLTETKDLLIAIMNLLELYYSEKGAIK